MKLEYIDWLTKTVIILKNPIVHRFSCLTLCLVTETLRGYRMQWDY